MVRICCATTDNTSRSTVCQSWPSHTYLSGWSESAVPLLTTPPGRLSVNHDLATPTSLDCQNLLCRPSREVGVARSWLTDSRPGGVVSGGTADSTTDNTSRSILLNSSKHDQAPQEARPCQNQTNIHACSKYCWNISRKGKHTFFFKLLASLFSWGFKRK